MKRLPIAAGIFIGLIAACLVGLSGVTALAAFDPGGAGGGCGAGSFFGFPHWWEYTGGLRSDGAGGCEANIDISKGNLTPLWGIVLAVIEILLKVAGMAVVVYIIIAGISYIMSRGNAEKTVASRTKIINALIGLAIAVTGATVVRFIGERLG